MSLLAFYGFILAISLSGVMSPGPLTALLIMRGRESPWAGVWITLGHALAEIPLILALFMGLQPFLETPGTREGVALAGGAALLYLGRGAFGSSRAPPAGGERMRQRSALAGGAGLIARTDEFGWLAGLAGMIAVHLLADAAWALLITWSSNRGSRMIGAAGWRRIERGCAWAMCGFGAFFLYDGLRGLLA